MLPRSVRESGRSATGVLLAAAVLFAALVAAHLLNGATVDTELLRLDAEANVPTWAGSLMFGLAGAAWIALAALEPNARWLWAALGLLALLLSLDELAGLHEELSARIGSNEAELVVQPLVGLAVIGLLVAVARRLGRPNGTLVLAAAVALALGHLAELGSVPPERGAVDEALQILEEGFEIGLAALLLAAAAGRGERLWRERDAFAPIAATAPRPRGRSPLRSRSTAS